MLLGARTGRDGIGGASVLASAELSEADHDKRPSVQIGDPLEENKLIECCLQLVDAGWSSRCRTWARRDSPRAPARWPRRAAWGSTSTSSKVPRREPGMEPFEVMISESQERMLCVVEPGAAGRRAGRLHALGDARDADRDRHRHRRLRVFDGGEPVGDMPVPALVDECPLYDLEPEEPEDRLGAFAEPLAVLPHGSAPDETLRALLSSANVASRRWAFEQYDFLVGSRTVRRPEQADASVLRLAHAGIETGRALAVSIDGNGRRVACDPYIGTVEAVCECAANLACVGAEPLGLTNCLNFGNPEKPHVAWQLTRAVEGMASACRAFGVPVVGGNVSLYNEGPEGPIYPTPIVGMVGRDARRDPLRRSRSGRRDGEPDLVALVGPFRPSLAGSELEKLRASCFPALPRVRPAAGGGGARVVREAVRAGESRALTTSPTAGSPHAWPRARARRRRRRDRPRPADPQGADRSRGGALRGRARGHGRLGPPRGPAGAQQQGPWGRVSGDRHGARTRLRIAAGAATIDLSVEEAGRLFHSGLPARLS